MQVLTRLKLRASYNILTPIVLLSLAAPAPTLAANFDWVITNPATDIVLGENDALTNRSTITRNAGFAAVYSPASVRSIINEAGGVIDGGVSEGVYISGSIGSFQNAGDISSAGDTAIEVNGHVTAFTNTGDILSDNHYAVSLSSAGEFRNSGTIQSDGSDAIYISNDVGTLLNSGSILGDELALHVNGRSGVVINSGHITSTNLTAVILDGGAEYFENTGDISARNYGVSASDGYFTVFKNSGSIKSSAGRGVGIDGAYYFENTGEITSASNVSAAVELKNGFTTVNRGLIRSFSEDGLTGFDAIFVHNDIDAIINSGTIEAYQSGIVVGRDATSIANSGTISGQNGNGITVEGDLDDLINHAGGEITAEDIGIFVVGDLDNFVNEGLISGENNGVEIDGHAKRFVNHGEISAEDNGAVLFYSTAGYFENTGLISGGSSGVYVSGTIEKFHNSGTIEGEYGIIFNTAGATLNNSGLITGRNGTAVSFSGDGNTLAIGTGARFDGGVFYGFGSNNYLDASNFHGSIVIETINGLADGNVIAGNNYYLQTPNAVLIVGSGFINQSSQPVTSLASGLGDLVSSRLSADSAISNPDDLVSSYYPARRSAAQGAVANAMAGTDGPTYWADAIGGAGYNAHAESADFYGALVAGAHTQLTADLTMGVMGGVANTTLDIGNGSQTIKGMVGVLGAYGSYDLGGITTDFSLIGGLSGNDSDREIAIGPDLEIASASFGGWFIAPTVGAYLPVLSTETGEISIGGRLGYLAGGFAGYTEDGSGADLIVDAQSYGVLTTLVELRGENAVSETVTITGSLGGFAQNQSGNAAAISLEDFATPLIAPGGINGTSFGIKASAGAEVAISDAFNINAGLTGTWRSSGTIAASANLGIGGKF